MTQFEKDVIDRLGRIETKLDADFRVLHGNGKPGLISDVSELEHRVMALEHNKHHAKTILTVLAWIVSIILATWANIKK